MATDIAHYRKLPTWEVAARRELIVQAEPEPLNAGARLYFCDLSRDSERGAHKTADARSACYGRERKMPEPGCSKLAC